MGRPKGSKNKTPEQRLAEKAIADSNRTRGNYHKGACVHGQRFRSNCKICSACEHGKQRNKCRECNPDKSFVTMCVHGRAKSKCKDCGGGSICIHGRLRHQCAACGGKAMCPCGIRKETCKVCMPETEVVCPDIEVVCDSSDGEEDKR